MHLHAEISTRINFDYAVITGSYYNLFRISYPKGEEEEAAFMRFKLLERLEPFLIIRGAASCPVSRISI
jgi:hypothetical protein